MAPPKRKHITFTPAQQKLLDKLSQKLQLNPTDVIRLALARLADAENIR